MKEISSKDNKIFKEAMSLKEKKYRDRLGLYLIEGWNLLEEAVKCRVEISEVFLSPDALGHEKSVGIESVFNLQRDGAENKGDYASRKTETYLLTSELFKRLSDTETSQGIIAVVKKPKDSLDLLSKDDTHSSFICLDRLQDPGNIGTILRTADAAGYSLAVIMKGTADIYSPKVVRAATGSLFRMPVVFMDDAESLKSFTLTAGKKIVATAMNGEKAYYEEDLSKDICLVIGNEGNGISDEILDLAEIKIRIPMEGTIESLNASVAAGILMYERIRNAR